MCARDEVSSFATCGTMQGCFSNNTDLQGWRKCLEDNVHSNMHGWAGGRAGAVTCTAGGSRGFFSKRVFVVCISVMVVDGI
jgi:hypothetical protein